LKIVSTSVSLFNPFHRIMFHHYTL